MALRALDSLDSSASYCEILAHIGRSFKASKYGTWIYVLRSLPLKLASETQWPDGPQLDESRVRCLPPGHVDVLLYIGVKCIEPLSENGSGFKKFRVRKVFGLGKFRVELGTRTRHPKLIKPLES